VDFPTFGKPTIPAVNAILCPLLQTFSYLSSFSRPYQKSPGCRWMRPVNIFRLPALLNRTPTPKKRHP
ncbi:hypothetical protein LI092_10430, partial [Streptococcus parasanguinis]|uniref:hypothetical protein n=1 Tax=Streptococcus parasanguinis TaxID=1318 RepID=UPI001D07B900